MVCPTSRLHMLLTDIHHHPWHRLHQLGSIRVHMCHTMLICSCLFCSFWNAMCGKAGPGLFPFDATLLLITLAMLPPISKEFFFPFLDFFFPYSAPIPITLCPELSMDNFVDPSSHKCLHFIPVCVLSCCVCNLLFARVVLWSSSSVLCYG